jgi:hypothetical protein
VGRYLGIAFPSPLPNPLAVWFHDVNAPQHQMAMVNYRGLWFEVPLADVPDPDDDAALEALFDRMIRAGNPSTLTLETLADDEEEGAEEEDDEEEDDEEEDDDEKEDDDEEEDDDEKEEDGEKAEEDGKGGDDDEEYWWSV